MLTSRPTVVAVVALAAVLSAGCEVLTREEARVAVEEIKLATEAGALTAVTVELSTDFTIGEGLERAAETLADFARSQVPCATITVAQASVTVDFGELGDLCVFQGRTYAGRVTWAITQASAQQIEVTHTWDAFRTARASLSGSATVTWDFAATTRRVQHEATWTVDGRSLTGTGDRTQGLLRPELGIAGGITIDGRRAWQSETGRWDLAIESVGIRWEDPIPESGRYMLTIPSGKTVTLRFKRIDEDTIEAVAKSGVRTFTFRVNRLGFVTSA